MFEITASLIPWLVVLAVWIFVIWGVLAWMGILKEIRSELRGIRDQLGRISGRDTADDR